MPRKNYIDKRMYKRRRSIREEGRRKFIKRINKEICKANKKRK